MFMLAASISLLISAAEFQKRLRDIRLARTDNSTWIVSQLEVNHLRLLACLDDTVVRMQLDAARKVDENDLALVKEKFDVLYSRIEVFNVAVNRLNMSQDMQQRLVQLRDIQSNLTREIDAITDLDLQAILAFRESVIAARGPVRETSVAALQEQSAAEAAAGDAETRLFIRFFVQSVILFVLMALGSYLVLRSAKELKARGRESARIAAILSSAFDGTLDGIVVLDRHQRLIFHNDKALAILNSADEKLRGKFIGDLVAFEIESGNGTLPASSLFDVTAQDNLIGKETISGVCQRADGSRIHVELSVIQDEDISGKTIIVVFMRDISDRVSAEENWRAALQRANEAAKAKSMFLATMSHEMRTPLHGMMASLALMEDAGSADDNLALLKTARDCSARALAQINDALELTRLGESLEKVSAFHPTRIVCEIIEELQALASRSGNRIDLSLDGAFDAVHLSGLPIAFSRALYNLTGNAVKFTKDGLISIRLTLAGSAPDQLSLTVEVEDTGIGIAPDDQARIFDHFETASPSEVNQMMGSGLGLAIAKLAVEQQGGKLELSSEPGVGSRFYFTIPLCVMKETAPMKEVSTPVQVEDAQPEAPAIAVAKKVLIVDDNEINLTLMAEMVKRLGHLPDMAKDGAEALQKANATGYDVILMDFSMPVMDGPTTTHHLRTQSGPSRCAVIIGVTALIDAKVGEGPGLLMDEVLTKPVNIPHLKTAIETVTHDSGKFGQIVVESGADYPCETQDVSDVSHSDTETENTFEDLCSLVGKETALQLLEGTLSEAQVALEALRDHAIPLADKALIVHKAVGSTAVTGLSDLSDILREVEQVAQAGQNPLEALLDVLVEHQLAEDRGRFAAILHRSSV